MWKQKGPLTCSNIRANNSELRSFMDHDCLDGSRLEVVAIRITLLLDLSACQASFGGTRERRVGWHKTCVGAIVML